MNEDPMWLAWNEIEAKMYDAMVYGSKAGSLVSFVNRSGHLSLEQFFSDEDVFGKVLEVGAGTGEHLQYVRHRFDHYFLTDINDKRLDIARSKYRDRPGVLFQNEDAAHLSFADNTFDRLISIYTLEHLPFAHLVIKEWVRVVKERGCITIAIPTEGGVAWRLGRFLTTRRTFAKMGLDLDYLIAREHINTCSLIVSLLRHYFPDLREKWYPTGIPIPDVNLIYACHIIVDARIKKWIQAD